MGSGVKAGHYRKVGEDACKAVEAGNDAVHEAYRR